MIYAGLSFVEMPVDTFHLGHGATLKKTYAHLMAPHMVAFTPAPPGGPHPPPWAAAKGGFFYDIHVELSIDETKLPAKMEAKDAIWLIAAIFRLGSHPFLMVPVLSGAPLNKESLVNGQPTVEPYEVEPRILIAAEGRATMPLEEMEWVKDKWPAASALLNKFPKLATALRAFDVSTIRGRNSASLLTIWGALETLFSPSAGELRYRVSSNVAAFLEPPSEKRLEVYRHIRGLYDARSRAAHSANDADTDTLVSSYIILRNALIKMIDQETVPSQDDFERLLFCGPQDT